MDFEYKARAGDFKQAAGVSSIVESIQPKKHKPSLHASIQNHSPKTLVQLASPSARAARLGETPFMCNESRVCAGSCLEGRKADRQVG